MYSKAAALTAALLVACVSSAQAAQSLNAEEVFKQHCTVCHAASPAMPNVPTMEALRQMTAEAILNSLVNGKMQPQGALMSDAERRLVAEYAAGKPLAAVVASVDNSCKNPQPMRPLADTPSWAGWGKTAANTRYTPQAEGGLTAADLPRLKLKWAFGFANVQAARTQPAVAGGRLFTASENSEVHALDPKTGCSYWMYKARSGVRTALSVGPYKKSSGVAGTAVFFGDAMGRAYGLDAETGEEIWTTQVDTHPAAAITGAPAFADGKLFVPVQGLKEEVQGGIENYECCTFRGSITTLDASTGKQLWKTYTVDEPKVRTRGETGKQYLGPAGGSIWSSPTVDLKRRLVYAAVGNAFVDPPQKMTNAVIAMSMDTGEVRWSNQLLPNDIWNMGCMLKPGEHPACPETLGPDLDFSASPAIAAVNGRELLIVMQKSGMAFALDPDQQGKLVWETRVGKGSGMGGQWGGAIDSANVYFGIADLQTPTPGGMRALRLSDGKEVWSVGPQPRLCGDKKGCLAGQGAALTAIPGAVLSSALDGGLRAYSTEDGKILWQFDTNREFQTVNGVPANGGGMDGPGPIVVDGMLFVNSGYGGLIGAPGNVLLAFGLE